MIKRLRVKFITIIMLILTLVLLTIFGVLNMFMIHQGNVQSELILTQVVEHDGVLPKGMQKKPLTSGFSPQLPFDLIDSRSFFSVLVDQDSGEISPVSQLPHFFSLGDISSMVDQILQSGKTDGKIAGQRFTVAQKPYGTLIVFLDGRMEENILNQLMWVSIVIWAASMIVALLISLYLSSWAIKPVQTAFDKQRQFVADASHELKTPITTIMTNADVLSGEIGENKWLSYIKSEAQRMNKLVTDLLYLAKYDSDEHIYTMCEFSLSDAVTSALLPLESVIYEAGLTIECSIASGVTLTGDESRIKQLVVILLDNAIKNAYEHSEIKLSLARVGDRRVLTVSNMGDGISEENIPRIFERFYRSDSSRARTTGGHGLGLTIAASIVQAHGGKITVRSKQGEQTDFIVTL